MVCISPCELLINIKSLSVNKNAKNIHVYCEMNALDSVDAIAKCF